MGEMVGLGWRFGRLFGLGGRATEENPVATPVAAPLALVPPSDAARGQMRRGSGEFSGLRALVADDSVINCTILRTFLERLGFEVTVAADGVQAVDRWAEEVFDLLCLDIEMPEMDGLTAFLLMKADAAERSVPMPVALAVTINAMTQDVTGYLQAGFDACLPKPFSRGDLVDLLRRRWPAVAA